jgi:hypothetical protein
VDLPPAAIQSARTCLHSLLTSQIQTQQLDRIVNGYTSLGTALNDTSCFAVSAMDSVLPPLRTSRTSFCQACRCQISLQQCNLLTITRYTSRNEDSQYILRGVRFTTSAMNWRSEERESCTYLAEARSAGWKFSPAIISEMENHLCPNQKNIARAHVRACQST